jgi:hypothetical protein
MATTRIPGRSALLRTARVLADLGLARVGERVFTIEQSHRSSDAALARIIVASL